MLTIIGPIRASFSAEHLISSKVISPEPGGFFQTEQNLQRKLQRSVSCHEHQTGRRSIYDLKNLAFFIIIRPREGDFLYKAIAVSKNKETH
jgi:hypothetical protein